MTATSDEACQPPSPVSAELRASTAQQRLATWHIGQGLNQLRWHYARAWITQDSCLFPAVGEVCDRLRESISRLSVDAGTTEELLQYSCESFCSLRNTLGTLSHAENIRSVQREFAVEARVSEFTLRDLCEHHCRELLRPMDATLREIEGYLRENLSDSLQRLMGLGEITDQAIRPVELHRMLNFDGLAAVTSHRSDTESPPLPCSWGARPSTSPESREPGLPSVGCEEAVQVLPEWCQNLRVAWERGPIPIQWCPIDASCDPPSQAAAWIVRLIEGIAKAFFTAPEKPVIRRQSHEYFVGEFLIRKSRGANVRKVLEAFDTSGWPPSIRNPFRDDQKKWSDTKSQLEDGLRLIKFHADGKGNVRWQWNLSVPLELRGNQD